MKRTIAGLSAAALLVMAGCDGSSKDTVGGPGATNPAKPLYGQADNTFKITASPTSLKQGETKTIPIGIKRGTNFQEEVTLEFTDLPKGVTVNPARPVIKVGDTETPVTFKAGADAAVGDIMIMIKAHPTKGLDADHKFKISVTQDPDVAAKAKRDEYVRDMNKQLEELDAKVAVWKTSAAKAEGQAKKDLEKKLQEAQVKRDVAAKKLDELKEAAPDRWEKMKDGAANAFDDLKTMFK